MRRIAALLACLWLAPGAAPAWAEARQFSAATMLRNESYGHVWVDPGERWAVVERRARYDSASDYGLGGFTTRQLSKLWRIDLARGGRAMPLFEQPVDTGYWAEGFSPSGRYLSVIALKDRRLRLGLFDMTRDKLRWLEGNPDMPSGQPGPLWLSDSRILRVLLTHPALPRLLDGTSGAADRIADGWRRQQGGRTSSLSWLSSTGITDPDRTRELRIEDVAGGGSRVLWRGEIADLALSADRRFVAVVSMTGLRRPSPAAPVGLDFQSRGSALTIIEIASGRSWQPCPGCDIAPNVLRWSPRGAALLVFARDRADAPWTTGALVRIDAATRCASRLAPPGLEAVTSTGDAGSGLIISASWAGTTPLLFARRGGLRADWYAVGQRRARALTGAMATPPNMLASSAADAIEIVRDGSWWRIGLDGRVARRITGIDAAGTTTLDPYHFGSRGLFATPPFAPQPLVRRIAGTVATIGWRGDHMLVGLVPGSQLLAVAPRSRRAVLLMRRDAGNAELVVQGAYGAPVAVDRINAHLVGLAPAQAVAIAGMDSAGGPLVHWLLLPSRPTRSPLPLVVLPYPGSIFARDASPVPGLDRVFAETNGRLLAAHGFAVLYPSLPLAADDREPVTTIAAGVDRAVDAAVATGRVDVRRIAVWGHSYGGYAALAVATRSQRYRAIVASAAPGNLLALYGTLVPRTDSDSALHYLAMPGATEGGQFRMGVPPWTAPDRYLRNSPALAADRIETPLLLVQGDLDFIPLAQSEALFTALFRRDRPVDLLRYRGENHVLASPANMRDMLDRVLAWLDARLAR